MMTSSLLNSEIEESLSEDLKRQKGVSITRPRLSQFILGKLALLIALILLVQGCANSDSSAAFVSISRAEETNHNTAKTTNPKPDDLSTPATQLASFQEPAATATALPPTPSNTPTARPSPTSTLAPTATATPTPTSTSTATLTPTASPTATSLPTATPTATASPTATSLPTATFTPMPTETPVPAGISHVVIISVDGMRPDALASADTPNLDKLIARGAYSPKAQTISLAETLPSHASMLGGMVAEKHGIVWGLPYIGWPGMNGPTLFTVAHEAGLSTAMVTGKEKLNYLALPNSVDQIYNIDRHDTEVKEQAIELIEAGLPNVLFIHFPDTDRVGHTFNWMSVNQLQAIAFTDGLIGEIVATLDREGYLASTLLIITADHGGHSRYNGDDCPEDRTIPWLAVGPGVPVGVTLTQHINTYDTAATAAYALGLSIPDIWDGRPVMEIFSQPEALLVSN